MRNLYLTLVLALTAYVSSMAANLDDVISEAYSAYDEDEYAEMQSMCDSLYENWDNALFANKCDIAILYYGLFDAYEQSPYYARNYERFMECFNKADKENHEECKAYIDSIDEGFYDDLVSIMKYMESLGIREKLDIINKVKTEK